MRPEEKEIISPLPENQEKRSPIEKGREFLNDALQVAGGSVIDYLNPRSEVHYDKTGLMQYASIPMAILGGGLLFKLREYEPLLFDEMKNQVYQIMAGIMEGIQTGSLRWDNEQNLWASLVAATGMTLAASGYSLAELVRSVVHNIKKQTNKKEAAIHHE